MWRAAFTGFASVLRLDSLNPWRRALCFALYCKQVFSGLGRGAILLLEVLRHGAHSPNPETLLLTFHKPNGKQCVETVNVVYSMQGATKQLSAQQNALSLCLLRKCRLMQVENQLSFACEHVGFFSDLAASKKNYSLGKRDWICKQNIPTCFFFYFLLNENGFSPGGITCC